MVGRNFQVVGGGWCVWVYLSFVPVYKEKHRNGKRTVAQAPAKLAMISITNLTALAVLFIGLVCLFGESDGYGHFDCCYKYTRQRPKLRNIKNVLIQKSSEVCDIDAVIFEVSPNKKDVIKLCANPNEQWVVNLQNTVMKMAFQSTNMKTMTNKGKGRRKMKRINKKKKNKKRHN
ncbi:uncharacterized protein O3C94_004890 [Discoglossus pictus]